ncbi:MAG: hypothetical protein QXL94_02980 [Candidatus Parvarchaeum sp.]
MMDKVELEACLDALAYSNISLNPDDFDRVYDHLMDKLLKLEGGKKRARQNHPSMIKLKDDYPRAERNRV